VPVATQTYSATSFVVTSAIPFSSSLFPVFSKTCAFLQAILSFFLSFFLTISVQVMMIKLQFCFMIGCCAFLLEILAMYNKTVYASYQEKLLISNFTVLLVNYI